MISYSSNGIVVSRFVRVIPPKRLFLLENKVSIGDSLYYIDLAFPQLTIAIEYQGEYHTDVAA